MWVLNQPGAACIHRDTFPQMVEGGDAPLSFNEGVTFAPWNAAPAGSVRQVRAWRLRCTQREAGPGTNTPPLCSPGESLYCALFLQNRSGYCWLVIFPYTFPSHSVTLYILEDVRILLGVAPHVQVNLGEIYDFENEI